MSVSPEELAAAMLKQRCNDVWRLYRAGADNAAEAMAKALILDPHLENYYKAGMHSLLSTISNNPVEHKREAVRLYTKVSERDNLMEMQRKEITIRLDTAKLHLATALSEQAKINREIQEKRAREKAMEEMRKRPDAEESGMKDIPDKQSVPEMAGESQLSSQPTVSPENRERRQKCKHCSGTGLAFDDNDPLPDGVRYKPGPGVKKNE
ncbi:hypothetical protein NW768_002186 [Fusarium equiseti]|uniref:Uncharacterized protein n=1 Tax=Fusarium equiseti TaxID=61235 RepID=A0ABQ8RNC3_FUSEQ|nr:hypothetical protein NW768_002186 [Fusarium equiseti]